MANVIKPKRSNTAAAVPTTGQITGGEIAVNMADRKIWINNGTAVVQIGAGNLSALGDVSITSPSNGQVLQYSTGNSRWENGNVSATNATNLSGGSANQIPYQTAASTTSFITAPSVTDTYLKWTGSAFTWSTVTASASLAVGTTSITGGTNGHILYNNNGTLGDLAVTGSGSVVLATSPTISGGTINNAVIGGTTPAAGTFTTITSATSPTNTVPVLHLTGTPNNAAGAKTGVLAVGPNFTASDRNIMASFVQNIDDYTQIVVQNTNSGTTASADIIVNNDNTTGAGVYGDFGINSSTYVGSGAFNIPNATYLYSQGGDLVLGTASANSIRFVANNSTTDAATFSSGGILTLATPLAIGSGGTGANSGNAALTSIEGFTTTATSGGTTSLDNTSTYKQFFTGTSNQTVVLPSTSTLAPGWSFHIVNNGTGTLTIQTSTAVTIGTVPPAVTAMPTALTTSGNTASDWEFGLTDFSTSTGTGSVVLNSSPNINFLSLGAGTTASPPLDFASGTNTTSPIAGAWEYDGVVFYSTGNTVSGRGYTPTTQIFRLTANGTNITTIANFFGANSSIQLAAGGIYEIEAYCYFIKNTAGAVTVTLVNSLAPVNMSAVLTTGAVGGGTVVAAANQAVIVNSTATSIAFGATGSLTNNSNHLIKINILIEANATASNLRIQFTAGTGSVTPLRTSYYKATRLPAANTGIFAA